MKFKPVGRCQGGFCTEGYIMEDIRGDDCFGTKRFLTVHIRLFREEIESNFSRLVCI